LGTPLIELATDDMLTIAPPPRSIIAGSTARMVRIIERTLRSTAKSKSASGISRIEPAWTKPAPLNSTSTGPTAATVATMSALSSTSSRRVSMPVMPPISASVVSLMSVAMTRAPAAANASAVARPMPWPAAVTSTVLSLTQSAMMSP
jgi:hypothetical protein